MSKQPSFTVHSYPWYISDWRESETRIEMNLEQRGLYRELLDYCYREGTLPDDPRKLAIIAGCTEEEFARAWPAVSKKFTRTTDQRLQHHRVNQILPELERWREQRRKAGQSSGLQRRNKKNNSPNSRSTVVPTVVEREHEPSTSTSTSSSSSTSTSTSSSAPAEHARAAAVQEHAAVNGKAPLLSKSDDDEKPKTYSNPEEELRAIYQQKAGEPITIAVLTGIRETLELKGVGMTAFVAEIRKHASNHWNNPAGFLRGKANKFRSETTPAMTSSPAVKNAVVQPEDKCADCGCEKGKGIKLMPDRTWIPCLCAAPEWIAHQRSRGVAIAEPAA